MPIEEVDNIIEYILQYLEGYSEEEYETTQAIVRISEIFYEYIIKVYKSTYFSYVKYYQLNKME